MKFREEVLAKIFTYITVIVLLGIVIFEAWSLQNEKGKRKEAENEVVSTHESLQTMIDLNADLKEKKDELEAFWTDWSPYAAFVESKEVLTLKTDLFTRPELIPREAVDGLAALIRKQENALKETDEEDGGKKKEESKSSAKEKETETEIQEEPMEFTFDNPEGENTFLPLNTGVGEGETCLVYTTAYEKGGDHVIELLYEIDFIGQRSVAERDENGEVAWKCVAWQAGDGWHGTEGENTEE